jgi:hypothetical protein
MDIERRSEPLRAGENRLERRLVQEFASIAPLINAPLSPRSRTARSNSSAAAAGLVIGRWAKPAKRSGSAAIRRARRSL